MGVEILRPQRSTFESYCSFSHSRTILGVRKTYQQLESLTEDRVTWRIFSSAAEPFLVFFNDSDMRLIVLPGFTGGVESHPINVMHQFDFCQDAFEQSLMPECFKLYPFDSTVMMTELSRLLRCGMHSSSITMMKGYGYTPVYEVQTRESWPISEIPLGAAMFGNVGSSKRVRTSSNSLLIRRLYYALAVSKCCLSLICL